MPADIATRYVGTSARGLTKEIEIPVPWGKIAGKVYGDPSNAPVLCVHGWLDNCNTFDKLIPLLPKDKFYVFVDIPGHGLSSSIPTGMFYNSLILMQFVNHVADYFKWTTFSFLSHSFGGNIGGLYSSLFPERIDKLILLDVVGLFVFDPTPDLGRQQFRSAVEDQSKIEKYIGSRPKTHTYEDAKRKLLEASPALTNEAADILLERGTRAVEKGRITFVHDPRYKYAVSTAITAGACEHLVSTVAAETSHIIASNGYIVNQSEELKKIQMNWIYEGFKSCQHHEITPVTGMHFVHLCHPERVIDPIVSMLRRPPRSGLLRSKTDFSRL